jgi:site-specific recombinase XerD
VQRKELSWSPFNQTVCALRFFYHDVLHRNWMIEHIPYPRHEKKLPVVLSPAEVAALFQSTPNLKHRALLMTIYAAGLRVSELVNLKVTDIDRQRQLICVRQGKGHKDRQVMLSPKLLELLRTYWKRYRPRTWLFPGRNPQRPITLSNASCPSPGVTTSHPSFSTSGLANDRRSRSAVPIFRTARSCRG